LWIILRKKKEAKKKEIFLLQWVTYNSTIDYLSLIVVFGYIYSK
jgi:hypothetical protein